MPNRSYYFLRNKKKWKGKEEYRRRNIENENEKYSPYRKPFFVILTCAPLPTYDWAARAVPIMTARRI